MEVQTVVTNAFLDKWTLLTKDNQDDIRSNPALRQIEDIGRDTASIESVFTLDSVQQYVNREIAGSPDPKRLEAFHVQRLTELAGLYAQVLFDLEKAETTRQFQVDRETLYQTALSQLKIKFISCKAYPCNDNSSQPEQKGWGSPTSFSGSGGRSNNENTAHI